MKISTGARGTTPAVFWQTESSETVRISATVKNEESGCPILLREGPRKVRNGTRFRITRMNASG